MKAYILTIGDEILLGQVVDTNSAWMGTTLSEYGVDVVEKMTVSDDHGKIVRAIAHSMEVADLILVTGGLGPTKDDVTKLALCEYFECGMVFSESTREKIQVLFSRIGIAFTKAHEEQCNMPDKAKLLQNNLGTAPGMLLEKDGKMLISMPGVPFEMKAIFQDEIIPLIKTLKNDLHFHHRTIMTAGAGETYIADKIEDISDAFPPELSLAFLPSVAAVRLRVTGKSFTNANIQTEVIKYSDAIAERLGNLVYGFDNTPLEVFILSLFKEKNLTLSVAESCTGGYLAHRLTSISGSSEYFLGGIVSYSNEMKMNILGVSPETLQNHGAVSEQTVIEMANGCKKVTGSTYAISISGIAGPGGGSPEKPVGTIWMAVAGPGGTKAYLIQTTKSRIVNIEYAAVAAMNKLRLMVQSDPD